MLTRRIAPLPHNAAFSCNTAGLEAAPSFPDYTVFPLEDTFSTSEEANVEAAAAAARLHRQQIQLQSHTRLSLGFPSELRADVQSFKKQILREEEDERIDCIVLAAKLSSIGYDVVCRRALGAGPSHSPSTIPGACFRMLQYEFLVVKCTQGDYAGLELFVDPYFREQFCIPHPSGHYTQLLQMVPDAFVGSRVHLIAIVELLCAEMALSFTARGLTVAPWRRTGAMLSKWLPVHAKDTPFASTFHAPPPATHLTSAAAGAAEAWLPFGADAAVCAAPSAQQQEQQQRSPANANPFAEVQKRREQEDIARQMATLEVWCGYQASPPCRPASPVAVAVTAAAADAAGKPQPEAGAVPVKTPSSPGALAGLSASCWGSAHRTESAKSSPPASPAHSVGSSDSSRRTSLLSLQLHQQVLGTPRAQSDPIRAIAIGAAHATQPVLHKVQYGQQK